VGFDTARAGLVGIDRDPVKELHGREQISPGGMVPGLTTDPRKCGPARLADGSMQAN